METERHRYQERAKIGQNRGFSTHNQGEKMHGSGEKRALMEILGVGDEFA